jgi:hypothetical protein
MSLGFRVSNTRYSQSLILTGLSQFGREAVASLSLLDLSVGWTNVRVESETRKQVVQNHIENN